MAWCEFPGHRGYWSVTRHADILALNRDFTALSSAHGIRLEDQDEEEVRARRTFQETDPPEHTRTRMLVAKAFSKPMVALFEDQIRALCHDILETALPHNGFCAVKDVARQLPMRMLGRILGTPDEDLDWLVSKGDALIANTDADSTSHVLDQTNTEAFRLMPFRSPAGADLYAYAQRLMDDKRARGDSSGVLHLITQPDAQGHVISDTEFRNFFCLLVAAGNDTTRYSIAAALHALANQAGLLQQLQGQPDEALIWDTAADEFIRWAAPAMYFRRTAVKPFELHGQQVKSGDKVALWFVSGNRDEAAFDKPFEANLQRSPNRHLSFGQGGPHVIVRGKYVPWRNRDGGARFCRGTFGVGYDKDLIPAPGAMVLQGLPDMEAVYSAENTRPGWEPNTRVVMCDLHDNHGQPLPQCGRGALKRAIADWQALGYDPMVGIELEAYAFQIEADGSLKPYDTPSSHVYATGPFADPRGFTDALWAQAAACGLPIDSLNTEYDSPQFELTLTFDSALKAVDDIVLFRLMAREVAFRHGILLTFLPEPLLAQGGSGVHVNFSLRHRAGSQAGHNAISGGHDTTAMNALTRQCIAGLMQHHGAIAGLAAPCVNSYERLKPASLSGFWQNWGVDHRNVTVRVAAEDGASARLEHRMGDGAANPYTLVATVLQAVGADLVAHHVFMKRNEVEKNAERDALGARDFYIRHI